MAHKPFQELRDKIKDPTTAEIRERHEELQGDIENLWDQCRGTPDASMDEELIAHQDRDILLDRLEKAEQTIKAASELSVFNSGLGYVFCRELNAALNRSKS